MQWCILAVRAALGFLTLSLADNSTTTIALSSTTTIATSSTTTIAPSSTTTIAPSSSSTVAVDVSTPAPTSESSPECMPKSRCYANEDCHDGGRCRGGFAGTCNCDPCTNFRHCSDDSSCGGLRGACDTDAGWCKCYKGLRAATGAWTYFGAKRRFCNKKSCGNSTDTCHGLLCNAGRCSCGYRSWFSEMFGY